MAREIGSNSPVARASCAPPRSSDAFEEYHAELETQISQGADPEDPDEYRAEGIFWVPPEACWSHLKARARQPTIGSLVDDAMTAVERDNSSLNGVLPRRINETLEEMARATFKSWFVDFDPVRARVEIPACPNT